jgi:hypothetical protein
VIEPRRQLTHSRRDILHVVRNGHDPAQGDAQFAQLTDQQAGVLVLGLAAQNFVADHKYRSLRYLHTRNHIHSRQQMEQKFIIGRH